MRFDDTGDDEREYGDSIRNETSHEEEIFKKTDRGDARLKNYHPIPPVTHLQVNQNILLYLPNESSIIGQTQTRKTRTEKPLPAEPPTQLPLVKNLAEIADEPSTNERTKPRQAALPPEIDKPHVPSQMTSEPHAPSARYLHAARAAADA